MTKTAPASNRLENLKHTIYKTFDTDNIQSIALMKAQRNNCDGESIRYFGERLLQGNGDRKIMFVFSDGMPSVACKSRPLLNKDLKDAVEELTAVGIEVIAFGIMTDEVKHFYPKHVVVQDVKDLPKLVSTQLKKILTEV